MKKPTNSELLEKMAQDKKELHAALKAQRRELSSSIGAVSKIVMGIQSEIKTLNFWRAETLGYEKGLKDSAVKNQIKSGDIKIPKVVWSLLLKVVGYIGVALTIILALINAKN